MTEQIIRELTGTTEDHLLTTNRPAGISTLIHRDAVEPFLALQADAKTAGFDLQIASGFRDYQQQLRIWNGKAVGNRLVIDSRGKPLDPEKMTERQLMLAILRWSALPGASRHHWGTDVDVYDAAAVLPDYQVQLVPDEVNAGGVFAALHIWLDKQIEHNKAYGFFRPYQQDRGGVAPERWHLSYAPQSFRYQKAMTKDALKGFLQHQEFALKPLVLDDFDALFERFIHLPEECYPEYCRNPQSPD